MREDSLRFRFILHFLLFLPLGGGVWLDVYIRPP